jgi:hypothetical protein
MASIETPIGSTGAKMVRDDDGQISVFVDGAKVSFFVTATESRPTIRNEIAYQKEQTEIVLNLVNRSKETVAEAQRVISDPNSTPEQRKNAERDIRFSGADRYAKQYEEKKALVAKLTDVESQIQAAYETNKKAFEETKKAPDNSNAKTAGDAVNPKTDGTGKDSSTNATKQPLTTDEKKNIQDSKKGTETSNSVVTDNKTSTGQAPSQANEEAKRGLFANPQTTPAAISVGGTKADDKDKPPPPLKITPNPLHAYATYTYSLSLHLLTPESYNKMANGDDWLPEAKTIIAGGGRWGTDKLDKSTFHRAAQFKDDFYFDSLSLDTIIGMNSQSRGANAIQFKFNIIEPYGFTLIDRLLELSIEMNQPNYLTNPYVLQIDFFGNNDAGEPMHPCTDAEGRSLTKYLPCKIIEIKIKVGTAGATYACVAVPYNHVAFAETVGITPANFEVVANTVGNFFTNDVDDAAIVKQAETRFKETQDAVRKQEEEERIVSNNPFASPDQKAKLAEENKKINATAKAPFKAKSYTGAYNAYQQYLKNNKFCDHPVVIKFVINAEIANSKIVLPETNSPTNTPAIDAEDKKELNAQVASGKPQTPSKPPAAGVKNDTAKFNINAGDQVLELINKVMRNSSYITDQLKTADEEIKEDEDGNKLNKDGKPMKWFKVIPHLKLTNFDAKRNDWGSEITYHIVPYQYHNSKHPGVSKSDNLEIRKNLRKKYSYIYSGENSDILDFALDFNTVFYTAVNVMTEGASRLTVTPEGLKAEAPKSTENPDAAPDAQITKTTQPNQIHLIGADKSVAGANVVGNSAAQRAADVMKSIYSSARGDMINVKLKIIGDPDFIKTDDVYYNPGSANYPGPDETHTPDGSILTDRGDIFAFLTWRTPVDLDQMTGHPDFTKYKNSAFDGVFKVIKVTCEFKNGGFDQSIDMIRFHDGVQDILSNLGSSVRGKPARDPAKEDNVKVIKDQPKTPEPPEGDRKKVDQAQADERRNNSTTPNDKENQKKANVVANGGTTTSEQQTKAQNTPTGDAGPLKTFIADRDRLYAPETGLFNTERERFNKEVDAARLIPNKADALEAEIKIKVERQTLAEQMLIYTNQAIIKPAEKLNQPITAEDDAATIDRKFEINQFPSRVRTQTLEGPAVMQATTLNQINDLYGQLKSLDPDKAEAFLATKDQLYAAGKSKARAKIGF